jgi:hypothetical protein
MSFMSIAKPLVLKTQAKVKKGKNKKSRRLGAPPNIFNELCAPLL